MPSRSAQVISQDTQAARRDLRHRTRCKKLASRSFHLARSRVNSVQGTALPPHQPRLGLGVCLGACPTRNPFRERASLDGAARNSVVGQHGASAQRSPVRRLRKPITPGGSQQWARTPGLACEACGRNRPPLSITAQSCPEFVQIGLQLSAIRPRRARIRTASIKFASNLIESGKSWPNSVQFATNVVEAGPNLALGDARTSPSFYHNSASESAGCTASRPNPRSVRPDPTHVGGRRPRYPPLIELGGGRTSVALAPFDAAGPKF